MDITTASVDELISYFRIVRKGDLGDFCMGRGLVALAAAKNGRKFFGTELNPKRLAVCVERLEKTGIYRKK